MRFVIISAALIALVSAAPAPTPAGDAVNVVMLYGRDWQGGPTIDCSHARAVACAESCRKLGYAYHQCIIGSYAGCYCRPGPPGGNGGGSAGTWKRSIETGAARAA
ncbi:hypothetical protein A1Q2_08501 [Trichosporon asahii var. asahii CBS 8904]|uniref:Invertebrate defensins family profile domain-containing protein n=1 Tax=Trichosporon asahii var. asahii (strain CBS 8904) TaxID=1220162 RepID=K1V002_TRIAC|nr:hypothetical protein A1Q2_08501 [Trichosporon asahii var. asahii CBS 8904]